MHTDALRSLIAELDAAASGLAVTVSAPIDRNAPDPGLVRVRDGARAAIAALERVRPDLDPADRAAVVERLADLEAEVRRQLGTTRGAGVACYVAPRLTRVVRLEVEPPHRVIVGERFAAAEAILDPDEDVHVVVLSTGGGSTRGARRYRLNDELTELSDDLLPYEHDVRDHGEHRKEEPPDQEQRDAYLEGFLNEVAAHLAKADPPGEARPIVLVGVARLRERFQRVAPAALAARIVAEVEGNHDRARDSELVAHVRSALDASREAAARAAVAEFVELPPVRTALGADDVYALAAEGRVHRLLVERGATDEIVQDGVVIEGRIASAVRACFDHGAELVVVPAGALGAHGPIAAVARW
jgi:hypothetical protein